MNTNTDERGQVFHKFDLLTMQGLQEALAQAEKRQNEADAEVADILTEIERREELTAAVRRNPPA